MAEVLAHPRRSTLSADAGVHGQPMPLSSLRGTNRDRTDVRDQKPSHAGRRSIVTQPAMGDIGRVVPFRRSHRPRSDQIRAAERDMADALRSFDLMERYTVALSSCPLSIASEADGAELPIVSFQSQLSIIQDWLDQLARINVANWPDTLWVLKLNDARSAATIRLDTVIRSLRHDPPGPGPLNSQLATDIRKFAESLRRLRQLIIQQFPNSLRVP
jgi:hypothetical protein